MASEDWILDTVVGFLHSPGWTVPIMTFIEENCIVFDTSEENKLEYTEIHNRYKEMVEYLLESFIEDLQIDATAFVKACHTKVTGAAESTVILFEQVMAAESFVIFKTMMVQKNIELELQVLRLIQKRNGVIPPSMHHGPEKTAERQGYMDEEEILQKIMKQSELEYKEQQKAKTVDENLDKVLATSKEEAERLEREKKKEEEIMKKAMEESKEEILRQHLVEQMESDTLQKVLKMSLSEQEKMVTNTAAMSQSSLQDIPNISTEKKSSSESKKTSKPISSKSPREPSKDTPNQKVLAAPSSSSKAAPSTSATASSSKEQSGSDAAASWLSSARAEAAANSTISEPRMSRYATDEAELKKREAYLKQQRDQLMAMKKKEREKSLNSFARNEESKSRPKSSRAARNATAGEVKVNSSDQEAEDKKMKMRLALAERLKKEVIQK